MAAAGPAASIAGGVLQAVAMIRQGQAAEAAANFNATVASQNAAQTRLQFKEKERRSRIVARKRLGKQRVAFAKGGVQITGSALDVLEESAANSELDALNIKHAGEIGALGLEREAQLEGFRGTQAGRQAKLAASGKLLQTAGDA